eukprot:8085642-Ditylum_brightwellii.AAC.1
MINLTCIYRAACQEHLNEALATVESELHKEDPMHFPNYGTTWETADYDVQIKLMTAFITIGEQHIETTALPVYSLQSHSCIAQELMLRVAPHVSHHGFKFLPANLPYDKSVHNGKLHYATLLKEQNQYLLKYEDFRVGGITEEILDTKFNGVILREKLELPGVVGDIMLTVFTTNKRIWQIETTTDQIVDAMCHVREVLA